MRLSYTYTLHPERECGSSVECGQPINVAIRCGGSVAAGMCRLAVGPHGLRSLPVCARLVSGCNSTVRLAPRAGAQHTQLPAGAVHHCPPTPSTTHHFNGILVTVHTHTAHQHHPRSLLVLPPHTTPHHPPTPASLPEGSNRNEPRKHNRAILSQEHSQSRPRSLST